MISLQLNRISKRELEFSTFPLVYYWWIFASCSIFQQFFVSPVARDILILLTYFHIFIQLCTRWKPLNLLGIVLNVECWKERKMKRRAEIKLKFNSMLNGEKFSNGFYNNRKKNPLLMFIIYEMTEERRKIIILNNVKIFSFSAVVQPTTIISFWVLRVVEIVESFSSPFSVLTFLVVIRQLLSGSGSLPSPPPILYVSVDLSTTLSTYP